MYQFRAVRATGAYVIVYVMDNVTQQQYEDAMTKESRRYFDGDDENPPITCLHRELLRLDDRNGRGGRVSTRDLLRTTNNRAQGQPLNEPALAMGLIEFRRQVAEWPCLDWRTKIRAGCSPRVRAIHVGVLCVCVCLASMLNCWL